MRAYLLTTVRRVAASWGSTARREQLVEDFAVFAVSAAGAPRPDRRPADLGADVRAMHEAERSLAMQAFRTLPERWQTVLWHTAVEDESPSEIAPLLGLTANATAVLAHRAREGLRQAYLQAHVSQTLTARRRVRAVRRPARRARPRRPADARGPGVAQHLKECARCRRPPLELADLNSRSRGCCRSRTSAGSPPPTPPRRRPRGQRGRRLGGVPGGEPADDGDRQQHPDALR